MNSLLNLSIVTDAAIVWAVFNGAQAFIPGYVPGPLFRMNNYIGQMFGDGRREREWVAAASHRMQQHASPKATSAIKRHRRAHATDTAASFRASASLQNSILRECRSGFKLVRSLTAVE